jgi:hypothetical protein
VIRGRQPDKHAFYFTYEPSITQLVHRSSEFKRVITNILGSFHVGKMFNEIVDAVGAGGSPGGNGR